MSGIDELSELFQAGPVAVLTGAGCSTESGIPDYRGPETRRRARNPIEYREFVTNPSARQRYWARALRGWRLIRDAQPNPAHRAIARLEAENFVSGVITQNVDRLHHAAGSRRVIELHGALHEVKCLSCGELEARDSVQLRLAELNPNLGQESFEAAPDGDADLDAASVAAFRVAGCSRCGGDLKPHVVFFGENVERPIVDRAYEVVSRSAALLVVGSSLAVFSGFRFVKRAHQLGLPVGLVNLGPTRADELARVRVEARAGETLPALADLLCAEHRSTGFRHGESAIVSK